MAASTASATPSPRPARLERRASAPRDGARHHRHAVTRAARTRSSERIATSRAPSPGTVDEAQRTEKEARASPSHWLGVPEASRASYFPQTATPVVGARAVQSPPTRVGNPGATIERGGSLTRVLGETDR